MTVREHLAAINEAKTYLERLVQNPTVGRRTLGRGRDHLNQVHNLDDADQVRAELDQLRTLADRHQQQH